MDSGVGTRTHGHISGGIRKEARETKTEDSPAPMIGEASLTSGRTPEHGGGPTARAEFRSARRELKSVLCRDLHVTRRHARCCASVPCATT